jgi:hypothetical protein
MKLIYRSTVEDYIKYAKEFAKSDIKFFSFLVTAVILSLLLSIGVGFHVPTAGYAIILAMTPFCFVFVVWFLNNNLSNGINKNIRKAGAAFFETDKSAELHENALELKSILREIKTPYNGIQAVTEDKDFIFIEFKFGDMVYIPIQNIYNIEDKDAFISALKEKIA